MIYDVFLSLSLAHTYTQLQREIKDLNLHYSVLLFVNADSETL